MLVKRGLYVQKKMCVYEERDGCRWKVMGVCGKCVCVCGKRRVYVKSDGCIRKEICICEKRRGCM